MSRIDEARTFLERWEPDEVELPDWIVDEIESSRELQSLFDRRFVPWEAGDLGKQRGAARRRVPLGLSLGAVGLLLAASALVALTQGLTAPEDLLLAQLVEEAEAPVGAPDDGKRLEEGEVVAVSPELFDRSNRANLDPDEPQGGTRHLLRRSSDSERQVRTRPTLGPRGKREADYSLGVEQNFYRAPASGRKSQDTIDSRSHADPNRISAVSGNGQPPPTTTEPVSREGQHLVKVSRQELSIGERVEFPLGSSRAPDEAGPLLDALAHILVEHPEVRSVRLTGHAGTAETDKDGGPLSQKRADEVRSALIARGIDPARLVTAAAGTTLPIDSNWTVQGQQRNARVEFTILDMAAPAVEPEPVPVSEPATSEEYTDYGHHSFHLTEHDALSTFSIDVDTASYTLVRRKLTEGYLPQQAAVRVEEFVNAFPYDYPRPPDGAPFGVSFEGAPNPFNPSTQLVRVGVQGRRVPTDQRRSVHLTFLVDTSGSMQSDDKLGLVKYALKELTGELVDGDTVALVAYAGSAGVILPPTPMSERPRVLRSLDQLSAGGSTAMGAGIELAYRLAEQTYHEGAVNRVIILSDGDANVGQTDPTALNELIRGYAHKGITLTVAGFGDGNYKDNRMERLADDGDGNYWYIDSERQARHVFVDQLTSTLVVIAKDVKLQVSWDPRSVVAYRLLGYENRDIADEDFRNDAVDAGEIGSGHRVTALYEVALAPSVGLDAHLATVSVRNKAPGPEAPAVERTFQLEAEALRPALNETGAGFRISVAAAYFAEYLRGSPHLHEHGLQEVEDIARDALRPEYPEDTELVSLIERARQLSGH